MFEGFCTGRRAALLAGIALGTMGGAGTALASGFMLLEQSATYQGASFAGSAARADDPSTLFYNPAGMTQLPGYQFSINGSFIAPQADLTSGVSYAGGTTGGNAAASVLLPSFFATAQIAPDWHVGLAVTSPFGLSTKYNMDSVARYNALTTSLKTYNFAPSVAWQALPTLSVAAGLRVEIADARLSQAVDFGGLVAQKLYPSALPGYSPGSHDGVGSLKGDDTAVGWQIGLLWQPLPGTNVGFDYRSAIFHDLSGSVTYQNVPAGLPIPPLQTALSSAFAGGHATAKLATPDTYSLSLAQNVGAVTLLAGLDYTEWSRFKTLLVNYAGPAIVTQEHWNNSFMVSAGADWRVTDTVTLRSGAAVDMTPTTNANRTPRIPDGNRYWLSIGATWKPIPKLALSAAYSHLFVDSTKVDLPGLQANYNSNQINILSAEATYSF